MESEFAKINKAYENAGIKKNTELITEIKAEIETDYKNGLVTQENYESLMKNLF